VSSRRLRHLAEPHLGFVTVAAQPQVRGCYKSTPSVAVRVTPLYRAEIAADVEIKTMEVLTVNDALLAPAGMNTLLGTLATPLLLERLTWTPPAGAGALRVTVPLDACTPPMTLDGLSVSELSVGAGGGAGCTVSEADRLTPP
jgi:hypothetical protein